MENYYFYKSCITTLFLCANVLQMHFVVLRIDLKTTNQCCIFAKKKKKKKKVPSSNI